MRAVIATNERMTHQVYWGKEFAEGLKKHGWKVEFNKNGTAADMVVLWGIRRQDIIRDQLSRGLQVCILERGYMLARLSEWTSVSFGGGLNGRGKYYGPMHDPSRWQKYFNHMQPWQDRPQGYAIVMGQVPGDTAVANVNLPAFYAKAKAAFESNGIPTRFREHPRFHTTSRPLANDLAGARCVVTWNSNSGVDAIIAGVPTVAMDIGSMAYDVSGHELTVPPMPDRAAWAHALAWKQWRKDEINSGYCWEMVKPC